MASCGTSLTEPQVKLLSRFTRRIIVNYDPDTAGQAATERSLTILLEQDAEVRVLALPGGERGDPDSFIRAEGAAAYTKLLKEAPPYVDYLIARARKMDLPRRKENLRAVNFLMPYVQRIPDRHPAFGMGHAHRAAVAHRGAGAARIYAQSGSRAPQRSESRSRNWWAARESRPSGAWCRC